jgi:hypothetical protein
MRPRFLIYTSFLLLAFLLVIFWLRPVKQKDESGSATESVRQATNAPVTSAAIANVTNQPPQTALPSINSNAISSGDAQRLSAVQEYNERRFAPIQFYGRVIDQDSNALPDVKINVSISGSQMFAPTASGEFPLSNSLVRLEKNTAPDGRFEITGERGSGVDIETLQKEGYEPEPNRQHGFGAFSGSLATPVIIKMWSTNIHEQLIGGDKKFQIVPDGRSYFINLTDGTIAESGDGDLKVWVKRPDQIIFGKRYDWSCETDVVGGGLLQETDANSSMYLAPTDGYTPSFQFEQKIGSGWGDTTGPKRFYVLLKNGKEYGRITIELMAYYNDQVPGMIRLSYAINPSGSPILR